MFHGFVLVLDSQLGVLYATENMTEQLGPYLVRHRLPIEGQHLWFHYLYMYVCIPLLQADVVGRPFSDLLHVEDRETLQSFLDTSDSFWHSGVQHSFVVRMKTTMASTVRSQAKVQYKVCVRVCVRLYVCSNALLSVTLCPLCNVCCRMSMLLVV